MNVIARYCRTLQVYAQVSQSKHCNCMAATRFFVIALSTRNQHIRHTDQHTPSPKLWPKLLQKTSSHWLQKRLATLSWQFWMWNKMTTMQRPDISPRQFWEVGPGSGGLLLTSCAASLTLATLLPQRSRLSSESLSKSCCNRKTESHRNYGESQIHWNCYSEIVTATTWPSEKVFGGCISLQLLLVSLPTCCPQLWLNLSTALTSLTGDSTKLSQMVLAISSSSVPMPILHYQSLQ